MNPITLILPGIGNSGPDHWQSLWQQANPDFVRIVQQDWEQPVCHDWLDELENTVAVMGEEVVLVAHSLSCVLVAHWAVQTQRQIKAALLVAPPDPDGPQFPPQAQGFAPMPLQAFQFPSIVVASADDPYGTIEFATRAATAWGSRFVNLGPAGHINAASGYGEWPLGLQLYQELIASPD